MKIWKYRVLSSQDKVIAIGKMVGTEEQVVKHCKKIIDEEKKVLPKDYHLEVELMPKTTR